MKVVVFDQEEASGMPLAELVAALREHGVGALMASPPGAEDSSRGAIGTLAACLAEAERALGDAGEAALVVGAGDWPLTGAIAGLKANVPVLRVSGGRPRGEDGRAVDLLALLAPVAIEADDPKAAASEVADRLRARS